MSRRMTSSGLVAGLALALSVSLPAHAGPSEFQLAQASSPASPGSVVELKNPWTAVGMSAAGGVLLFPLPVVGLGAGYLYAGDPARGVAVGLGSVGAIFGGFMLGALGTGVINPSEFQPGGGYGAALVGATTAIVTGVGYSIWALSDVYQTTVRKNEEAGSTRLP